MVYKKTVSLKSNKNGTRYQIYKAFALNFQFRLENIYLMKMEILSKYFIRKLMHFINLKED